MLSVVEASVDCYVFVELEEAVVAFEAGVAVKA
jgi:hypothetical protein